MLLWMREGSGAKIIKFVLFGLLLMAVCGLVLMDVGGFFKGGIGGASSNTVVRGGGISIGVQEFDRTVRRSLSGQGIATEEAYSLGLINQIAAREINSRLFSRYVNEIGLRVDDDSIALQIDKITASITAGGQSKAEAIRQILRSQGIGEAEFVSAIRQEMASGLLQKAFDAPPTLTSPLLASQLYRYDNERRSVSFVFLKSTDVGKTPVPTESQLQSHYDLNKPSFLVPETRIFSVATLPAEKILESVVVPEENLRATYEQNKSSYQSVEQRVVEQALFKTQADAQAVFDILKTQRDKTLKDSVSVESYTAPQAFQKDGLLPEVADLVFAATQGDIIPPVQTDDGWRLLVLKEIIPPKTQPFEEVKAQIAEEAKSASLTDKIYETANAIEDSVGGGETFETLLSSYGMTMQQIGPVRANGIDSQGRDVLSAYLSVRTDLLKAAFEYGENDIPPVIQSQDGTLYVLRIESIVPDAYQAFETVKDKVKEDWMNTQKQILNKSRAADIFMGLQKGDSLKALARTTGASILTIQNMARHETALSLPLTPVVRDKIFSLSAQKDQENPLSVPFSSDVEGGIVVGVLEQISMPALALATSDEIKKQEEETGKTLAPDLANMFVDSLSRNKKIEVNQELLEKFYQRKGE